VSALPAEVFRAVNEMVVADASLKPAGLARVKAPFPQLDPTVYEKVTKRVSSKKTQLKQRDAKL
jgi:hypothetical protein